MAFDNNISNDACLVIIMTISVDAYFLINGFISYQKQLIATL